MAGCPIGASKGLFRTWTLLQRPWEPSKALSRHVYCGTELDFDGAGEGHRIGSEETSCKVSCKIADERVDGSLSNVEYEGYILKVDSLMQSNGVSEGMREEVQLRMAPRVLP